MSLRRIFRAVLLVFLKEAGKEVEFAIFPGGNTNLLVTVAVTVVAVTVVAVTVVAVTVSVVTVTVSVVTVTVSAVTVWLSAMPVDIDRSAHGQGDGAAKGTTFQVQGVVFLCEFPVFVEPVCLHPPGGKAKGEEEHLQLNDLARLHEWSDQLRRGSVRNNKVAAAVSTTVMAAK